MVGNGNHINRFIVTVIGISQQRYFKNRLMKLSETWYAYTYTYKGCN